MQGDISQPKPPKRQRPAPTPTIDQPPAPPQPDLTIDEAQLEAAAGSKKKRKVLIAPHKHFKRFWGWWTSLSRNVRFGIIAVLLLLFGGGAIIWFRYIQPNANPSLAIIHHPKKKPTTVASPLTGVQVSPADAARPVTGIMIENSTFARPQSGLQEAGVVIEAIAEGGITRFMAIFQDASPQYIGPVRSLRPYYLDFASPYQASIVHVGGSPDALSRVRNGTYRDLDQFFNAGYFRRITSRASPHNVYTSFAELDKLNQSKSYNKSQYTPWPRKADKKMAVPTAKTIDIHISSPDFYSHYDYDPATNSYARSEGGAPHMELASNDPNVPGVQIKPKVVIALVMDYGINADGQHSEYTDTGSGTAYIFQDGGVTQATWNKADNSTMVDFKDSSGATLKLNAGQTWITLVADSAKVTYSP